MTSPLEVHKNEMPKRVAIAQAFHSRNGGDPPSQDSKGNYQRVNPSRERLMPEAREPDPFPDYGASQDLPGDTEAAEWEDLKTSARKASGDLDPRVLQILKHFDSGLIGVYQQIQLELVDAVAMMLNESRWTGSKHLDKALTEVVTQTEERLKSLSREQALALIAELAQR